MKLYFALFTFFFLSQNIIGLAQPGTLDSSFGTNGKVLNQSVNSSANTSILQDDGKIIVAGNGGPGLISNFILQRYIKDGGIDSTFGINGYTLTDLGIFDEVFALAIEPDKKIIAAGHSYRDLVGSSPNFNIALARYFSNGILDSSFGQNGTIETDFGYSESAYAVIVQTDGKIVVGGSTEAIEFGDRPFADFLIVRYMPDGTLDESFGNNGKVVADYSINRFDIIRSMALQQDGKIIVAGSTTNIPTSAGELALARYETNGALDNSFGTAGLVRTDFGEGLEEISSISLQPDGKIIGGGYVNNKSNPNMIIIQYNADGTVDEIFGNAGKVNIIFSFNSVGKSLSLQKNGKIVISGVTWQGNYAMARCLTTGVLDSSFGTNGKVITDFGGDDNNYTCLLQEDGKIILSGYSAQNIGVTAIARYFGDPINQNPIYTKIKRWIRKHVLNFEYANTNAAYYVIEKSTASNTGFVPVTRITANAAATNYSYTLPETATQSTYRIKAVNKDNSITYSSPISSSDPAMAGVASFTIYPNPAKDRITVETSGTVQLRLQNSNGRVLLTQTVNGKGSIDISKLPNGIYYVVNTVNGESLKVVKE